MNKTFIARLGLLVFNIVIITLFLVVFILDSNLFQTQEWLLYTIVVVFILVNIIVFAYQIFLYLSNKNSNINQEEKTVNDLNYLENNFIPKLEEEQRFGIIFIDSVGTIKSITPFLKAHNFEYFIEKDISFLNDVQEKKRTSINFENKIWDLTYYSDSNFVFARENTSKYLLKSLTNNKFSILRLKIYIDESVVQSVDASKITTFINENFVAFFDQQKGFFIETFSRKNFIGIFDIKNEEELKNITKSFIYNLDAAIKDSKLNFTYNIGIGIGLDFLTINKLALQSITAGEQRGINQVVIKSQDGNTFFVKESNKNMIYGKNQINEFYREFQKAINKSDKIFIATHRNADLDALGSILGTYMLVKAIDANKEVKIYSETLDNTTLFTFNKDYREYQSYIISDISENDITAKSMLIVTDTSSIELLEREDLPTLFDPDNVFNIDHHKISSADNVITKNDLNALIVSNSSSAAELVVELFRIKLGDFNNQLIPQEIATILLAGIYLDTNSLSRNMSSNTYEALAWLNRNHASIEKAMGYISGASKSDLAVFKDVINNIKFKNNKIVSYLDESVIINPDEVAIFANDLLDFKDINASFFIAKVSEEMIKVSARSSGEFNVQTIAEQLGGGGTVEASAIEFNLKEKKITIEEIKKQIIDLL